MRIRPAHFRAFAGDIRATFMAKNTGPNDRPDLLKAVRFYLAADRDADPYRGNCFEELDHSLSCTHTQVYIEFYRTATTQTVQYGVTLVAIYDENSTLFISRIGFDGEVVPARFVPIDAPEARYGYLRRYTPTITDWRVGEPCVFAVDGADYLATALRGGTLGQPSATVETADWKRLSPNDLPTQYGYTDQQINALLAEKGDAEIQAEHTQQLATLAVQASQVYGYLEDGGAPVGFGSLNASLADERQRIFQTFNVATLSMPASNPADGSGWAYATNAQGTTLNLAANVVLSLPGSDGGTLTFADFYIQGGRGSKVRLLTTASNTTPPALLPRLSGYCRVPLELAKGGAVLLSGYYVSLTGTGTAFVVEPFQADNVAAGVKVVRLGGGGGEGDDGGLRFQAQNVSGNAYNDLELFVPHRLDVLDGQYNLSSWEAQVLGPDGLALSAVVNTQANLNNALVQAFAGSPAFVLVRHRLLRAATTDAAQARFTYILA